MTSCRSTLLNQKNRPKNFPHHLCCKACEGKKLNSESTTSVMITGTISSHESSSLAICRLSAHCCLFWYSLSKMLAFVSVANAMIDTHRNHLALDSNHR